MLKFGFVFLGIGCALVGMALWHMGPCATTPQVVALLVAAPSLLAGLVCVSFGLAKLAKRHFNSN